MKTVNCLINNFYIDYKLKQSDFGFMVWNKLLLKLITSICFTFLMWLVEILNYIVAGILLLLDSIVLETQWETREISLGLGSL